MQNDRKIQKSRRTSNEMKKIKLKVKVKVNNEQQQNNRARQWK